MNPAIRTVVTAAVLLAVAGCYQDYTPVRGYVDSPTTVPLEQEDRLIEDGEALLQELDLQDVADVRQATRSFGEIAAANRLAAQTPPPQVDPLPPSAWIDRSQLPLESWEVHYLRGQPLGYVHRVVRHSGVEGLNNLVTDVDAVASVSSASGKIQQRSAMEIIEEASGGLRSLTATFAVGEKLTKITAKLVRDELQIVTNADGKVQSRDFVVEPPLRGPFAVDESLTHKPMKPGEQRLLRLYDPTLSQPVEVQLTAKGQSQVALLSGQYADLLEIEQMITAGEQTVGSAIWTDDRGRIIKRYFPYLKLTAYAVQPDVAQAIRDAAALESLAVREIVMPQPAGDPSQPQTFRISSKEQDPAELFQSTEHQQVRSSSGIVAEVTIEPIDASRYGTDDRSTAVIGTGQQAYQQPGGWIASDDPRIKELAEELHKGEGDTPMPLRLAKGIGKKFELKPSPIEPAVIRPVAEVAAGPDANVFELAMLTCAVARGSGLPSRVAIGYTADSSQPTLMRPHAWTEVWIGGRWLGIDATGDDGKLGTDTIKLADTAAADQNPYAPILEAYQLLPHLQISPLP